MKYWILAVSLFILGCSGGESSGTNEAAQTVEEAAESTATEAAQAAEAAAEAVEEEAATVGDEVADAMNDAQQAAGDVEAALEQKKTELDEELDKVENAIKD